MRRPRKSSWRRYKYVAACVLLSPVLVLLHRLLVISKDISLSFVKEAEELFGVPSSPGRKRTTRRRHVAGGITSFHQNEIDSRRPLVSHKTMEFSNRTDMIQYASRPFQRWNGTKYGWCVSKIQRQQQWQQQQQQMITDDQRTPNKPQGLMFSKTFKTGSSSAAAVTLQIAHQVGRRQQQQLPKCRVHFTHEVSLENRLFSNRNTASSLLWSTVRSPIQRAISAFYFYRVGLDKVEPSDENFVRYLEGTRHQQVIQLRLDRPSIKESDGILKDANNKRRRLVDEPMHDFVQELNADTTTTSGNAQYYRGKAPDIIRQQIMHRYDFLAVQDRMDESLVVLKLLWDLDDGDIIVLSSKRTGSYSWNWKKTNVKTCFQIPKAPSSISMLSPAVQEYLRTKYTWETNADFLLYAAANHSLDWTIDHTLGRSLVDQHVQRHRQLQALVEKHCQKKAIFPCNEQGYYQDAADHDCYFRDMGCGFRCIDNVLEQHRQGKLPLSSS